MDRLTINEAIKHAREVAKGKRADADWKWRNGRLNSDDCISCAEEHEQLAEWLEELKAYKDAEEQGLLLRLPCHIGDILYEPTNRNTISEYRVTGFKREVFALWIEWKLEKGFIYQSIYGVEIGEIGKTVFLTKEEAEQVLAEMKAGEENEIDR